MEMISLPAIPDEMIQNGGLDNEKCTLHRCRIAAANASCRQIILSGHHEPARSVDSQVPGRNSRSRRFGLACAAQMRGSFKDSLPARFRPHLDISFPRREIHVLLDLFTWKSTADFKRDVQPKQTRMFGCKMTLSTLELPLRIKIPRWCFTYFPPDVRRSRVSSGETDR